MTFRSSSLLTTLMASVVLLLCSCSTAYYGAMEKVGFQKRDLLVKRVKNAKKSQIETKEDFQSALDEFLLIADTPPSELEARYKKTEKAYKNAERQAAEVKRRHDDVENVSKHLFREWKGEIDQYQNPEFARESSRQLVKAEVQSDALLIAMRKAESKIDPVLKEFRDYVLFLKHNLNARAVASLEGQVKRTKIDVSRLISEMNAAISEADSFIQQMDPS